MNTARIWEERRKASVAMERRTRAGGVEGEMAVSPAAGLPFWDRETLEKVGSVRSLWRRGAEEGDGEGTCQVWQLKFTWGSVGMYNSPDQG
jgi:hypothetical protein